MSDSIDLRCPYCRAIHNSSSPHLFLDSRPLARYSHPPSIIPLNVKLPDFPKSKTPPTRFDRLARRFDVSLSNPSSPSDPHSVVPSVSEDSSLSLDTDPEVEDIPEGSILNLPKDLHSIVSSPLKTSETSDLKESEKDKTANEGSGFESDLSFNSTHSVIEATHPHCPTCECHKRKIHATANERFKAYRGRKKMKELVRSGMVKDKGET